MTLSDRPSSLPVSRQVQVLQVPDCPLVDGLLTLIRNAEAETGVPCTQATVSSAVWDESR